MFIARPTEVLKAYVKSKKILPYGVRDVGWQLGRLSVGLEILTVIKALEDQRVPMLALQREETISVLQTLLREMGMEEQTEQWYEMLGEWRRPTFVPDEGLSVFPVSRAFVAEALRDAPALVEHIPARLDSDQSQDLPSGESDEGPDEEGRSTPSE